MEHRHEVVNFPDNSPVKIFIHKLGDVNMHWHRSLELLYIVKGSVKITVGGSLYTLGGDDIILINSKVPHSLTSENATMIAAQIKLELLSVIPDNMKNYSFDCVSASDDKEKFLPIKQCLASLLKFNVESSNYTSLINISLCYKLMYELYLNFCNGENKITGNQTEQLTRLNVLLGFINENFADNLSLDTLAGVVNVTPAYLSKSFKTLMGMTVSDYIKNIRLHQATFYLSTTNDSTDIICEKCGFPNTHSFLAAFKEKYSALPSRWRKENKSSSKIIKNPEQTIGYQTTNAAILYSSVTDFIKNYADASISAAPAEPVKYPQTAITVKDENAVELNSTERAFIGVSRTKELLYAPVREMLTQMQKEIGFEFVKMHSVFDDDLMVYSEYDGKPHYNFNYIDEAYDFLLSIGLKPFVQLSFMPSALAAQKNKTTFYTDVITSPPGDVNKWNALVEKFVKHLIERYSKKEVEGWPFAVWNEPFTSQKIFGFADKEDYYRLYLNSYRTIKNIDGKIAVGGPSHFAAYGKSNGLLFEFLSFTKANSCIPDFIDLHYYDTDMSRLYLDKNGLKISTQLSPRAGTFGGEISKIKAELADTGFKNIPVYLTEWNSTTSHRDLLSDTCFKSAYIVKNVLENYGQLQASGYWLLTDLHEESLLESKLFHGGLGMFTVSGIKKPAYFSYLFLSRLGDRLLKRGDGYFVTKRGEKYVILLYNYAHYSAAYSEEVGINTSYTDRYSVFPDSGVKAFDFDFPELNGKILAVHNIVNREHGSAFDNFVAMGAVEPLSGRETEWLKKQTEPLIKKEILTAPLHFSVELQPLEIRLIEISEWSD